MCMIIEIFKIKCTALGKDLLLTQCPAPHIPNLALRMTFIAPSASIVFKGVQEIKPRVKSNRPKNWNIRK